MNQKRRVDTRGLSCPQPVIEVMNALNQPADCYEVLADNRTAVENISRFLTNSKKSYQLREAGDDFIFEVKEAQ